MSCSYQLTWTLIIISHFLPLHLRLHYTLKSQMNCDCERTVFAMIHAQKRTSSKWNCDALNSLRIRCKALNLLLTTYFASIFYVSNKTLRIQFIQNLRFCNCPNHYLDDKGQFLDYKKPYILVKNNQTNLLLSQSDFTLLSISITQIHAFTLLSISITQIYDNDKPFELDELKLTLLSTFQSLNFST